MPLESGGVRSEEEAFCAETHTQNYILNIDSTNRDFQIKNTIKTGFGENLTLPEQFYDIRRKYNKATTIVWCALIRVLK